MVLPPSTLAGVLTSLSVDEFLRECLGRTYFIGKGQPGKFAGLLSWDDLNGILRHHRLDVPRLRVVQDGRQIPPDSFIAYRSSRRQPSARTPRLRAADLTAKLRDGATLIVDSVDELHEPITQLAEDFEQVLRARVQVNMYAGWRTSRGFDLHWDDHDVIVLQIAGRKHWKVYPMTREYPIAKDAKSKTEPPQTPIWEGMLEDGDFLYIPRGWWHVAVPLDEPTLHLTFGLHRPNGTDLLTWFTERLQSSAVVRQDLPRFATPQHQAEHMEKIREALAKCWSGELMTEFLAETDARSQPRPRFSLPWSATPSSMPSHDNWSVQWIAPRPVAFHRSEPSDTVAFACMGRQWTFALTAAPLLELLQERKICSMPQLLAAASGDLSSKTIRAFVKELSDAGLVTLLDGGY